MVDGIIDLIAGKSVNYFVEKTRSNGLVNVSIPHPKANKQHATQEIAERSGIDPKKMMGVGNGYNDIPFLEQTGVSVAVANAVPEVKALANYMAPAYDRRGAAIAAQELIIDKKLTRVRRTKLQY